MRPRSRQPPKRRPRVWTCRQIFRDPSSTNLTSAVSSPSAPSPKLSSALAGSRRRAGERGRSTTRHAPALPIAAGLHHPRMRPLSLRGNGSRRPLSPALRRLPASALDSFGEGALGEDAAEVRFVLDGSLKICLHVHTLGRLLGGCLDRGRI